MYVIHYFFYRKEQIILNQRRYHNDNDSIHYYDLMASYVDELRVLQRTVRSYIR